MELPATWLIGLNIGVWLVVHLAVAWLGTQLPVRFFSPGQWLYRERPWEAGGRFYERRFSIRQWKDRLPDGARLFAAGFPKGRLKRATPAYLDRFVRETCRGEAIHWVVFGAAGLFFLWNPWWAGLVMIAYAAMANIPCILSQRYNRLRLFRVLARSEAQRRDNVRSA